MSNKSSKQRSDEAWDALLASPESVRWLTQQGQQVEQLFKSGKAKPMSAPEEDDGQDHPPEGGENSKQR